MFNIAKNIYVGWDPANTKTELPEATMIPFGETAKEKKKLEKLTSDFPSVKELDNVPLPGFTLHDVSKKKWSSTDSTWLVIDPRGFLVRITSKNLANILKVTGITEGLIQDRCVWARDNEQTEMMLVPISSSIYQEAVEGTELIDGKVSISDVKIGDTVLLQNKLQGVYLGSLSLYCSMQYTRDIGSRVQKMLRKQIIEVSPGKFHYQTDAKILKIVKPAVKELTREESAKYINDAIAKGNTYFTPSSKMNTNYYSNYGMVKFVSTHAAPKVDIRIEPITRAEADAYFAAGRALQDNGFIIVEDDRKRKYSINYPWGGTIRTFLPDEFIVQDIKTITSDTIEYTSADQGNYFYYLNSNAPKKTLDSFKKFYKIVKCVKNDIYV